MFACLKQYDTICGSNISNIANMSSIFHNLEEKWVMRLQHRISKTYHENKTPHITNGCWCFAMQYKRNQLCMDTLTATSRSSVTKRKREVDDIKSEEDVDEVSSPTSELQLPFRIRKSISSICKRQRQIQQSPEPQDNEEAVTYALVKQPSGPLPDAEDDTEIETSSQALLSSPTDSSIASNGNISLDMLSSYSQWHSLLQAHAQFELRDYFYNVTGTYMICTEAFQDLGPDRLRLSIKINYLRGHSTKFGVLDAYLDLGVIKGPVMLGLDKNFTAEYLWATTSDRELQNEESRRLYRDAIFALSRRPECISKDRRHDLGTLHRLPPLNIGLTRAPSFDFQSRVHVSCDGKRNIEENHTIKFRYIKFDLHCRRFEGCIELDGDRKKMIGFKVCSKKNLELPKKWSDVRTDMMDGTSVRSFL